MKTCGRIARHTPWGELAWQLGRERSFAAGRGEALKRLLIEGEAGHDPRFWRLAQALSALYPRGSDEKRWVDGILARKKGLGL